MREYNVNDAVVAVRHIGNVSEESTGTVLVILNEGEAYEVEFFDSEGESCGNTTVHPKDIKPMDLP